MKNVLLSAAVISFLYSCNSNTPTSEPDDPAEVAKIMIPQSSCFASASGKDTILLKIEVFPNVVTGILKYQIEGKDRNDGTIEGKLEGNKIFADYTFSSEGKISVREVAFLINEGIATEGFGDMEEKNGKMVFKNKESIEFSKGLELDQIDCVENDDKFQIK